MKFYIKTVINKVVHETVDLRELKTLDNGINFVNSQNVV